jgi:hypothetical protein
MIKFCSCLLYNYHLDFVFVHCFFILFFALFAIISLHCTCYSLCSSGLFAYRVSYRMAVRELDNSWSLRFETFNQSFLLMLIYSYVC